MTRTSTFAARPARGWQETARPINAKPQLIFWPGPARNMP